MGDTKKSVLYYWLFRLFLVIAIALTFYKQMWVNIVLSIFILFIISIPDLMSRKVLFEKPSSFEVILILFVYFSIFAQEILKYFIRTDWIDNALRLILGIIVVLIGFFLVYAINREKKATMVLSSFFIAFFSFCFALSAGLTWELFKYALSLLFDINLQVTTLNYLLLGLSSYFLGALLAATLGYIHMRFFDKSFMKQIIVGFLRKNPVLFSNVLKPKEYYKELLRMGESEQVEFKGSIRTNLYTKQHDKRMEYSLLKTIVAFLNTKGGTLLLGVSDEGEILGLEQDNFKNKDKMKLHISMLLDMYMRSELLKEINFESTSINHKNIMKVICGRAKKPVFLNYNGSEEFFVRIGPSSVKLRGSKLISYVNSRFKKIK